MSAWRTDKLEGHRRFEIFAYVEIDTILCFKTGYVTSDSFVFYEDENIQVSVDVSSIIKWCHISDVVRLIEEA